MLLYRYFISGVEGWVSEDASTLIVLGDSITDGRGSDDNKNNRYVFYTHGEKVNAYEFDMFPGGLTSFLLACVKAALLMSPLGTRRQVETVFFHNVLVLLWSAVTAVMRLTNLVLNMS